MNLPPAPVRPQGVTILAILAAIGGIIALLFGVCIGVIGGAVGGILAASGAPGVGALVGIGIVLGVILTLITGVLDLVFAYGAWYLRPWGWTLGVAAAIFGIANELFRLIFTHNSNFFGFLIGVAISGAILYYLFTPDVKKAFGRP